MIKWGQKSNPQKFLDQNLTPKNSQAEFPSHTNFQRNYTAGIRGNYHESSDCLEYPKKSLLKSSYPKNTCGNFPNQNWKFQTPKNPSIITVTWNPEFPPPLGCLQLSESQFAAVIVSSRNAPPLFGRSAAWRDNHTTTSLPASCDIMRMPKIRALTKSNDWPATGTSYFESKIVVFSRNFPLNPSLPDILFKNRMIWLNSPD